MTTVNRLTDPDRVELGAFVLRLSLGVMFIAHAGLKYFVFTLPGTDQFFMSLGLPSALAYFTFGAELVGGILLLLGVYSRYVALALVPILLGATWAHLAHLRVAVLDGSPERRRELLAAAPTRELTVIGVDLVPWLVAELSALADDHPILDVLIVDETSRLKDPSGKRARALLRVAKRFRTRWGLTGTPRPNSSMDLFMPAAVITNGAL